jgi:hypothetical protein
MFLVTGERDIIITGDFNMESSSEGTLNTCFSEFPPPPSKLSMLSVNSIV